jgi:hypothetical protein
LSGNSFQLQAIPFLWLISLALATSFSQQQLTATEPSSPLTYSPTNSTTPNSPAYNTSARPHRKHRAAVAVRLLFSGGMAYSIVACAGIGTNRAENTSPQLLFMGRYLVTGLRVRFEGDRHSNMPDQYILGSGGISLY